MEAEQRNKRFTPSSSQGFANKQVNRGGTTFPPRSGYGGSGQGSYMNRGQQGNQPQMSQSSVRQPAGSSASGERPTRGGIQQNNPRRLTYPQCSTCGKFHEGECRKRARTCYECGEAGHIKRDCPSMVQFGGAGQGAVVPRNQSGSRNYPPNS